MEKKQITLAFEEDKLEALEYYMRKENSTVQKKMDEALRQLYENAVPEAVREFMDRKTLTPPRPKRSAAMRPTAKKEAATDEKTTGNGQEEQK